MEASADVFSPISGRHMREIFFVNLPSQNYFDMTRIDREKAVVGLMIAIYCRKHGHGAGNRLCSDCAALLAYAESRLDRCPKGEGKSSCRKCDIHCYSPANRDRIRTVMRYVGPRMIFYHPLSAVRHLIDEMR